jgi:hypothetical protein
MSMRALVLAVVPVLVVLLSLIHAGCVVIDGLQSLWNAAQNDDQSYLLKRWV